MTQAAERRAPGDPPLPDRLLAVATRMFAEKGFGNTSVQEIVEAAGVTKGAMYHYFGSKDDLLYEIYHRLLLGQGRDPRGIAKELGVTLHTCRGYVKGVLAKLGVHSQLEAVVLATRTGLIRLGD